MATNDSNTSGNTNDNQLDFYWVGVDTKRPEGGVKLHPKLTQ